MCELPVDRDNDCDIKNTRVVPYEHFALSNALSIVKKPSILIDNTASRDFRNQSHLLSGVSKTERSIDVLDSSNTCDRDLISYVSVTKGERNCKDSSVDQDKPTSLSRPILL